MTTAKPRRHDGDRLGRLVDRHAEGSDRAASDGELHEICGRSDQHLSETHDAEQHGMLVAMPAREQRSRARMMCVVSVERADQHVGES